MEDNLWIALKNILSQLSVASWLGATVGIGLATYIYFSYWAVNESAVPYGIRTPEECLATWKGEYVANTELSLPGSNAIQCYCPANGKLLGTVNPASAATIDQAISRATTAQKAWAETSFAQRRKVLRTLLRFILQNQDEISTAACLDTGKTKVDASLGEILVTAEKLKWTILHGEAALKAERRPTSLLMAYKINEVRWEPLGVVAACVSWNYPFHNFIAPVISAIFAGNGIVVKGSEATAWSSSYFADIARSALSACGHSPELVQSITCWPSIAPHLTSHPGISHLTFIGSRQVGHSVAAAAAQSLTPVCMELGGKDAAVILDDVSDLAQMTSILLRGVFQSAGQNCIGIERVIACRGVYHHLIQLLEPRIRALRVGSALDDGEGVDVGALISDSRFDRLESLIDEAVKLGARCLVGGKRYRHPKYPRGHFFQPTLLVDVTPDMAIAVQETFAPICLVMKAANVDQAIEMANSSPYALGASVFGRNPRALEQVVSGIQAGMVSVNDFAVYYAVQLPFGGVKGSGYGRFAGIEGLRSLCNTKAVCRDRFPRLLRTHIPPALLYPIPNPTRAWRTCLAIVDLGYADSWSRQLRGLIRLLTRGAF